MDAQSPIPNPLPNDDEDVSWALSTAGALWGRGERAEALKWLRRAAEQASDVNDDVRALTLFKAAAEVAQSGASTPPPPSSSIAPAPASVPAPQAMAPSTFPPQASTPPPRKPPPSLPPRNVAPPPAATSSRGAPAPAPRTTPPPAAARQVPSSGAPSPATKPSRTPTPAPAVQISPAARSMPSAALNAASAPVQRAAPAPAPRASAPARGAGPGATVPTRPVASRPPPAAYRATPPPGAATERPPPPSRSGRAFEEVLALQHAPGGLAFDDLDENTQVLQAVRSAPLPRGPNLSEIEQSFHQVLPGSPAAEAADEITDQGLRARAIDDGPPDDQTGPISAPERTMVTKWTEAERAAFMASPDTQSPETTSRRFAPLLAHRVAVVAGSRPGEIRLVPLDASGAPPIGAAIALLVPLSAADGDVVAQLFGSLE